MQAKVTQMEAKLNKRKDQLNNASEGNEIGFKRVSHQQHLLLQSFMDKHAIKHDSGSSEEEDKQNQKNSIVSGSDVTMKPGNKKKP